jgi:hypothetical protein
VSAEAAGLLAQGGLAGGEGRQNRTGVGMPVPAARLA